MMQDQFGTRNHPFCGPPNWRRRSSALGLQQFRIPREQVRSIENATALLDRLDQLDSTWQNPQPCWIRPAMQRVTLHRKHRRISHSPYQPSPNTSALHRSGGCVPVSCSAFVQDGNHQLLASSHEVGQFRNAMAATCVASQTPSVGADTCNQTVPDERRFPKTVWMTWWAYV